MSAATHGAYWLTCTCGRPGYVTKRAGNTALRSTAGRRGKRVYACEASGLWHIGKRTEPTAATTAMPIDEVQRMFADITVPTTPPLSAPTKAA